MRLFKLEIKKVLGTRQTWIIMAVSIILSVLMAYLPVTFEYISYVDETGSIIELKGMDAIKYKKILLNDISGIITPEKVRLAVEDYQECLQEHGVSDYYELPEEVYVERILPYSPLISGAKSIFSDPDTGFAPPIMEIESEKIDDYYAYCDNWIVSLMKIEQRDHPVAQKIAIDMYNNVEKPFEYYSGISSNAIDYELILTMLILILCTIIAAPVFSSDYQTKADDILRCTKLGRFRLGITKIIAAISICFVLYSLCITIFILISNSLFGWESTKTSMQLIFSIVNLADFNIGELQFAIALAGLLSVVATVCFTMFISSKCNNVIIALSMGLVICIAPVLVYIIIPGDIGLWIRSLLPSNNVGIQSSFLYSVIDFEFLNIGKIAVWTPWAMLAFAAIEIPLFIGLAVYSYVNYRSN